MIEKPADIIHHIVGEELGKAGDDPSSIIDVGGKQKAIEAHLGWKMAFTVKKTINSKKLIEEIAKESKLFPFFKGDKLSFNSILDVYDETNIEAPNGFKIKDSDVISYKFDRNKIEDIKTKVVLNYYYDYASDEFKKSTKSTIEADTAEEFFNGYSNTYYGIPEDAPDGSGGQGGDPIEVKYIRDKETAESLQRFLLAWYCNQHNTCKIKLPLRYLYAEVGDIVGFPTLLNSRKAYGEDYSLSNSDIVIRNGQQIFPYWMIVGASKALEYVDLDLIQMHNLEPSVEVDIQYPPVAEIDGPIVVIEGTVFELSGEPSYDPEGGPLTYNWTVPSGYGFNDGMIQTFLAPNVSDDEYHTFELVVTDETDLDSNTSIHTVRIINAIEGEGGSSYIIQPPQGFDEWLGGSDPGGDYHIEDYTDEYSLEGTPHPVYFFHNGLENAFNDCTGLNPNGFNFLINTFFTDQNEEFCIFLTNRGNRYEGYGMLDWCINQDPDTLWCCTSSGSMDGHTFPPRPYWYIQDEGFDTNPWKPEDAYLYNTWWFGSGNQHYIVNIQDYTTMCEQLYYSFNGVGPLVDQEYAMIEIHLAKKYPGWNDDSMPGDGWVSAGHSFWHEWTGEWNPRHTLIAKVLQRNPDFDNQRR